ncbi:hypothetical protein BRYFOR_09526 [Marvinbryantia formatexigens DSM 14469]|uniref:Uncharacterized protein n=1 Tax=Marvinbryantia formatexigens DSM 14469 TaxID=478749 RepID=C6LLH9_9FIRM|nr:hypothetical protein BRYFOR_09526 [Marvinbryantia formatexigens DSM 14469]
MQKRQCRRSKAAREKTQQPGKAQELLQNNRMQYLCADRSAGWAKMLHMILRRKDCEAIRCERT